VSADRIGLLQLGSGVAGDMLLGALVGAGASFERMDRAVRAATGGRAALVSREVTRAGLAAIQVEVHVDGRVLVEDPGPMAHRPEQEHDHAHGLEHDHAHDHESGHAHPEGRAQEHNHGRSYAAIDLGLEASPVEPAVRDAAREVFRELAEAESRSHGVPLTSVHFHEVGELDAVADIVGAAAGFLDLGLVAVWHGPVAVGGGSVGAAHGRLPVPAPAVLELLRDRPWVVEEGIGELATPTGAALLRVFASPVPASLRFTPQSVGAGAGSRDLPDRPNVVRLLVGTAAEAPAVRRNRVAVIETALDDATPEEGGDLIRRFLDAGALDVTLTPLLMKKGRPGFLLRVVAPEEAGEAFAGRVLRETTSLGARWRVEERLELPRREERVRLPEGEVRVKVAVLPDGEERVHPEYEDLRALADATGIPVHRLRRRVESVWDAGR